MALTTIRDIAKRALADPDSDRTDALYDCLQLAEGAVASDDSGMTAAQGVTVARLFHNAVKVLVHPATNLDGLPEGYVCADVTYGSGATIYYGIAPDGRASS